MKHHQVLLASVLCIAPVLSWAADEWLLVEFARSLPPCEQVATNSRCWGTEPDIVSFEMRDGETLSLPAAESRSPVWVRMQRLWVSPDQTAYAGQFSITLDRTPLGARVQVVDDDRQYLQSVPVNQWTALEDRGYTGSLWVRVSTPVSD